MATQPENQSRRSFLKGSTAAGIAASGFQIIKPELVRGAGKEKLTAGIIGCGGRGTRAVNDLLSGNPNVELVAMADLFEDQLEKSIRRLRGAECGTIDHRSRRRFISSILEEGPAAVKERRRESLGPGFPWRSRGLPPTMRSRPAFPPRSFPGR